MSTYQAPSQVNPVVQKLIDHLVKDLRCDRQLYYRNGMVWEFVTFNGEELTFNHVADNTDPEKVNLIALREMDDDELYIHIVELADKGEYVGELLNRSSWDDEIAMFKDHIARGIEEE